jgi:hypothetical protein
MEKIEALRKASNRWNNGGDVGEAMTDLFHALLVDEPKVKPAPRYIPKGVPCVVWNDGKSDANRIWWSKGNGKFVAVESDIDDPCPGINWDHARPVCFPDWSKVPHWVKALALRLDPNDTWIYMYEPGQDEKEYQSYYETRPEVTR